MPATMPSSPEPVGALDPDRETSPIVGESEFEFEEVEPAGTGGTCLFNGAPFPVGAWVRSGSEVLRCEPPGVWVREGELAAGRRVLD